MGTKTAIVRLIIEAGLDREYVCMALLNNGYLVWFTEEEGDSYCEKVRVINYKCSAEDVMIEEG